MEKIALNTIHLAGLCARTCIADEIAGKGVIGATIVRYFGENWGAKIAHKKQGGLGVFCVYADYESDEHGAYTFFIGEEVTDIKDQPQGLETLTIDGQNYTKITTPEGPMPNVVIEAWQDIWANSALKEQRRYHADFEIYDHRAANPQKTVVDIYIGMKD